MPHAAEATAIGKSATSRHPQPIAPSGVTVPPRLSRLRERCFSAQLAKTTRPAEITQIIIAEAHAAEVFTRASSHFCRATPNVCVQRGRDVRDRVRARDGASISGPARLILPVGKERRESELSLRWPQEPGRVRFIVDSRIRRGGVELPRAQLELSTHPRRQRNFADHTSEQRMSPQLHPHVAGLIDDVGERPHLCDRIRTCQPLRRSIRPSAPRMLSPSCHRA